MSQNNLKLNPEKLLGQIKRAQDMLDAMQRQHNELSLFLDHLYLDIESGLRLSQDNNNTQK